MNRKIGMFGGKFLPLHQGHVKAILEASTLCDELYVILSYDETYEKTLFKDSPLTYIPHQVRLRWIRQITKALPHVKSYAIEDKYTNEVYDWEQGANKIKALIGKPIDVVFSGEESYTPIFNHIYPDATHYLFDRTQSNISGTMIRKEGVFKHWEQIPNVAKSYFTKKVMIVGTESCGKSTLVHNLAAYFNTNYVEEYGRRICEELDGYEEVFTDDLFPHIAYKQKVLEYEAVKQSNKIVFIDTESLVTSYYYELFSGKDDDQLYEAMSNHNAYDLWLYLEPDVKWVDDGLRTMGDSEVRQNNNEKLKTQFLKNKIPIYTIKGNYQERFSQAIQLVNQLLHE